MVECMFGYVRELADLPPGVELAAALSAIDLATVPNRLMVEVLRAHARQAAHHQGLLLAALAEVGRTVALDALADGVDTARSEEPLASASGEIAAALTLTQRRADTELALAETVVRGLPRVFAALLAGEIDRAKAWVFADHLAPDTCGLSRAQIDAVCARLVPLAPGWTTGQLAARLWRAVLAIDPDHARRRYDRAVRERGVVGYLAPDGTVTISGSGLGVPEAVAACERLERLARAVKRAGHPGLLGQIQADLYVGMLDGRWQHATEQEIIANLLGEAPPAETPPVEAPAAPAASARSRTTRPASARPTVTPVVTRPTSARPPAGRPTSTRTTSTRPTSTRPTSTRPTSTRSTSTRPTAAAGPASGPPADAVRAEAVRVGVEVRVGLSTLLGLDDRPGEVPGVGPVLAEVARDIVAAQHRGARWRFAVTDDAGYLLLAGITRCRPGSGGSCVGGIVELHVPANLLTQLSTHAGGYRRYGAVIADIAAQYAHHDRVSAALDARPEDRFAHAGLARHIQVRDRYCCHPGCRRPASKSQLDHTVDHARGGATTQGNTGPGCTRHHLIFKHQLGWALTQPEPGHFEWTSPLGQVYRTRGEPIIPDLPEPLTSHNTPDQRHHLDSDDGDRAILRLPPPEGEPQPPPAATTEPPNDQPPPF